MIHLLEEENPVPLTRKCLAQMLRLGLLGQVHLRSLGIRELVMEQKAYVVVGLDQVL
jgi:hypothetical protein